MSVYNIYVCMCVCLYDTYMCESKYGSKSDSMKKAEKHVLNTFNLRTLCARLYLFIVYILFAPVISTSIHRCVNNSPDIKVLMKVIETETFNVDFTL